MEDYCPPHAKEPLMRKRKRMGEIYITLDELNRLKLKSSTSYTDAESDRSLTFQKDCPPNDSQHRPISKPSLHLQWHFDETHLDRRESAELMTAFNEVMKVLNEMNAFDDDLRGTASERSLVDSERTETKLESFQRFKQPMAKLTYSETGSGIYVKKVQLGEKNSKKGQRQNLKTYKNFDMKDKFQGDEDAYDNLTMDSKARKSKEREIVTGNMIHILDEDVTNAEVYKKRGELPLQANSCESSLLYGEEVRFHGTVRDLRGSTIYRVFSVDLRSSKQAFFQNSARVVSRPKDTNAPGYANTPLGKTRRQKLLAKHELVPVVDVDEVFSGPEWKCFDPRKRVKTILNQFQYLVRFYQSEAVDRADVAAGRYLMKKKFCFNDGRSVVGSIPGVEVGDMFKFRVELLILIVSRTSQAGIEYIPASLSGYVDKDGCPLSVAVSVVSSGGYKDDEDDGETLIYVGSGGDKNKVVRKLKSSRSADHVEKDQELIRGNLALKNSCDLGVPVRVIRGEKYYDEDIGTKRKGYRYDGLYDVLKCYYDVGSAGSKVWKFRLVKRKKQGFMLDP
ncbi:hypothetical protein R1flu_012555 [Riccia fluitans]|uniref:YDG domain-containing protein n=1 Tax=Riccia fluitans TaxID=41844 RepID=A0ABD1ZAY7_9MARC